MADVPACPRVALEATSRRWTGPRSGMSDGDFATGLAISNVPVHDGMVRVGVRTGSRKMFLGPCVADPAGGSCGDAGTPCFLDPCVPPGDYEYGYQVPAFTGCYESFAGLTSGESPMVVIVPSSACAEDGGVAGRLGFPPAIRRDVDARRRRWCRRLERNLHQPATGAGRWLLRLGVARRLGAAGPVPSRRRDPLLGLRGRRRRDSHGCRAGRDGVRTAPVAPRVTIMTPVSSDLRIVDEGRCKRSVVSARHPSSLRGDSLMLISNCPTLFIVARPRCLRCPLRIGGGTATDRPGSQCRLAWRRSIAFSWSTGWA